MELPQSLVQYFDDNRHSLRSIKTVVVACSGGPDSVALSSGLKEIENLVPYRFVLVHVNHLLRGKESNGDARFVESLAKKWGWPLFQRKVPVDPQASGNLEEAAREGRYKAFVQVAKSIKSSLILTAHTLDDQAETMFMNLLRGTGPAGLGGIHPLRKWGGSQIYLGRPLLHWTKKELESWLKKRKTRFRLDSSNLNKRFLRNWIRGEVIPRLEKKASGFKVRWGQLSTLLREDEEFWNNAVSHLMKRLLVRRQGGLVVDFKQLDPVPLSLQRRFLRRVLGQDLLSFEAVEGLRRWMKAPPTSGRIWQTKNGWIVERLSKSKGSPSPSYFWLGQRKNKESKIQ